MKAPGLVAALLLLPGTPAAAGSPAAPSGPPNVTLNLASQDGVAAVSGTWRYRDVAIVEVDFREPGPDGKPGERPNRTLDYEPHAEGADFDDSGWEILDPGTLDARRGGGRVAFAWYRLRLTIPEQIGAFDPRGSKVVFETVVDDYAEVWIDGRLDRELGQAGGTVVAGFNVPNRVVVTHDAVPGREIVIAVFAMNGPVSAAPSNYIWMRSAKLDFYRDPRAVEPVAVSFRVEKHDGALDRIVPPGARLEKIADGFIFGEGPVWLADGRLLFSDPNANRIYRWDPAGRVEVFRDRSGYQGADVAAYSQPGSNGLTLDADGRLTVCEHGNRRVTRLETDGTQTVLADRWEGRRLNSPNDLVYRSDGALYFTDPPFGLPKYHDDPRRELDFSGVFLLRNGKLDVVSRDLSGPNGLAFSPDERYLYVANWDEHAKIVMRYPVRADGSLDTGTVFHDLGAAPEPEALDGLKVDVEGNVYVSGPGGVWIFSPAGTHLGTIRGPELPANFAWGDGDARTLYLTSRTGLYRMRLGIPGVRPPLSPSLASARAS